MEISKVIGGFVTILVGLALGPTVFAQAVNVNPLALNGTAATIAGIVPLVYYVGVLTLGIGLMVV